MSIDGFAEPYANKTMRAIERGAAFLDTQNAAKSSDSPSLEEAAERALNVQTKAANPTPSGVRKNSVACNSDAWAEPKPITPKFETEPFPQDALPMVIIDSAR